MLAQVPDAGYQVGSSLPLASHQSPDQVRHCLALSSIRVARGAQVRSIRWLERMLLALPSARSVAELSCHPPAAQVPLVLPTATVEVECSQADVEYDSAAARK